VPKKTSANTITPCLISVCSILLLAWQERFQHYALRVLACKCAQGMMHSLRCSTVSDVPMHRVHDASCDCDSALQEFASHTTQVVHRLKLVTRMLERSCQGLLQGPRCMSEKKHTLLCADSAALKGHSSLAGSSRPLLLSAATTAH
jgi:hypothetical protein